jgi:hypothetical protein
MLANFRLPSLGRVSTRHVYHSNLLPALQALLATLADLDLSFESDVQTVRNSTTNEALKREVIERMREEHRARRAPYVRQMAALEERLRRFAA